MKENQETGQALSLRSLAIGVMGSTVLSASSLYMALRMGALPWPIVFAALSSTVVLKALGSDDIHEANVCHAAMSAGSMIAGGLAFTLPAVLISHTASDITLTEALTCSLSGFALGMIGCAAFHSSFLDDYGLTFPIGTSAANTLKAAYRDAGQETHELGWGLAGSAAWAWARDWFHLMPAILPLPFTLPGVSLAVMNSPMILALGAMIGMTSAGVWFLGSLIGNLAILQGLPAMGVASLYQAEAIRNSLGIGCMLGVGLGIVASRLVKMAVGRKAKKQEVTTTRSQWALSGIRGSWRPVAGVAIATVAGVVAWAWQLGLAGSLVLIGATWFCCWLSAWLTGESGVNPMELFGILALLLISVFFRFTGHKELFFCSAVVSVACGITGDVMSDLKAGHLLGTPASDQLKAMAAGGAVGAVVSALMLVALIQVFGANSFGANNYFVSAQANVVAVMAQGIPHVPAFWLGIATGLALALFQLPVMTLGLGIYLPFHLSFTAFLGALLFWTAEHMARRKDVSDLPVFTQRLQTLASGVLGGESFTGVLIALISLATMFLG